MFNLNKEGICHLLFQNDKIMGHFMTKEENSKTFGIIGAPSKEKPSLHPCCIPNHHRHHRSSTTTTSTKKEQICDHDDDKEVEEELVKFWDIKMMGYETKEIILFKQVLQPEPENDAVQLTLDYDDMLEVKRFKRKLEDPLNDHNISNLKDISTESSLTLSSTMIEEEEGEQSFDFITNAIKVDEEAKLHIEKYFNGLENESLHMGVPLVCIGYLKVHL